MKLLVVSHSCVTAINQQLYAEVAKQTGWQVDLVVPSNWKDEYGRQCGVTRWPTFEGELIGVPVLKPGNIILHAYRCNLAKLLRRVNADAVYVNHEPYAVATAQVYAANRLAGRKPIGFYSCQNINKRYPLPFRTAEAAVLKSSAFAFPISHAVDVVFRAKGYVGPSTILPLAIDTVVYHPRPVEAAELRRTLVPNGEVLLGFVGRFVPEKGLRTLVDALRQLKEQPWRLVLVGAGPMEAELRQLIDQAGLTARVTFTGFIPHEQAPAYLSAIDLLVLPSETQPNWKEQFGRVLLEAMACGTPVLGSDSGEIPTLIAETGGGTVFRERISTDLANKLTALIQDTSRRDALATAGAVSVRDRYSIQSLVPSFSSTLANAWAIAGTSKTHSLVGVN